MSLSTNKQMNVLFVTYHIKPLIMIRGYWLRCSLDPRLGAMEDMKEVLLEKTSNCYSHDSGGCTIVLTKKIGSEKPRKLRRANIENIFISLKKETVL